MNDDLNKMDAYMCIGPEYQDYYMINGELAVPEWVKPIDVVIAPTRGKAKYLFHLRHKNDFEFTEIQTYKIASGEIGPARVLESKDPTAMKLWGIYLTKVL